MWLVLAQVWGCLSTTSPKTKNIFLPVGWERQGNMCFSEGVLEMPGRGVMGGGMCQQMPC